MIKDAYISDDELYRYSLVRDWQENFPVMLFVMLNPSTADAVEDDPTIRRCIGFAERENCGAIEVVNLFAYRATDPKAMKAAEDPIGPENDQVIREALLEAEMVVCAWGAHGSFQGRSQKVLDLIRGEGHKPMALGVTKAGEPRHPLYLPANAPLEELK